MDPLNDYIAWMRALVNIQSPHYAIFFEVAFDLDFRYDENSVPGDKNRAMDGLLLRNRFESETSIRLPDLGECSVLEFLAALAVRMGEATYNGLEPDMTSEHFSNFLNALDISELSERDSVIRKLTNLIDRNYDRWGSGGGLFPLRKTAKDQRKLEIWYQMQAYLNEKM